MLFESTQIFQRLTYVKVISLVHSYRGRGRGEGGEREGRGRGEWRAGRVEWRTILEWGGSCERRGRVAVEVHLNGLELLRDGDCIGACLRLSECLACQDGHCTSCSNSVSFL